MEMAVVRLCPQTLYESKILIWQDLLLHLQCFSCSIMPVPRAPGELYPDWGMVTEGRASPQGCCWGLPAGTGAAIDGMADEVWTVLLSLTDWKLFCSLQLEAKTFFFLKRKTANKLGILFLSNYEHILAAVCIEP